MTRTMMIVLLLMMMNALGFVRKYMWNISGKHLSNTKDYHMINGSYVRQMAMQISIAKQVNGLKSLIYLAKIIY